MSSIHNLNCLAKAQGKSSLPRDDAAMTFKRHSVQYAAAVSHGGLAEWSPLQAVLNVRVQGFSMAQVV